MTKEPKKGSYQKKPQTVEERSIKKTAALAFQVIRSFYFCTLDNRPTIKFCKDT